MTNLKLEQKGRKRKQNNFFLLNWNNSCSLVCGRQRPCCDILRARILCVYFQEKPTTACCSKRTASWYKMPYADNPPPSHSNTGQAHELKGVDVFQTWFSCRMNSRWTANFTLRPPSLSLMDRLHKARTKSSHWEPQNLTWSNFSVGQTPNLVEITGLVSGAETRRCWCVPNMVFLQNELEGELVTNFTLRPPSLSSRRPFAKSAH